MIALLGAIALPLEAQRTMGPEFAAGVAVPSGGAGQYRNAGPVFRAGLLIVDSARVWRLRLDGEAVWLPGSPDREFVSKSATRSMGSIGAMASLVIGPARFVAAPYVVVGIGVQHLHVRGRDNPYGISFAGRAGAGVRANVRRFRLSLEVARHLVLTDHGTGDDFVLVRYRPVTLGVAF